LNNDDGRSVKPDDFTPYLIPPKGRPYRECWAEEDKSLLPTTAAAITSSSSATPQSSKTELKKSRKSLSTLKACQLDDLGLQADSFCLPLTERLVSALLDEPASTDSTAWSDAAPQHGLIQSDAEESVASFLQLPTREEMFNVEQRLKSELAYLGILDSSDMMDNQALAADPNNQDDEISIELKRLQGDLRRLTEVNDRRKLILREMVRDRLAYQEYLSVVEEMNRQIYTCYQRRFVRLPVYDYLHCHDYYFLLAKPTKKTENNPTAASTSG
jgi:transcriptional adapter 3